MDDKFKKLMNRCKNSITLRINDHRDMYETVEYYVNNLSMSGIDEDDISVEMLNEMIRTNTIIELRFYPDTAIGSYTIYDCDYDNALDRALVCLNIKD